MTATALVAAALGIVVGTVIGGLGGGGGVLTVPALVYVLGQDAHDATTGGVLIVGVTALVGTRRPHPGTGHRVADRYRVRRRRHPRRLPRHAGQPQCRPAGAADRVRLPHVARRRRDAVARRRTSDDPPEPRRCGHGRRDPPRDGHRAAAKIVVCGVVAGFLTGFLGVGGGFLVVPALVVVLRMPMSLAIGTSLFIIVINAASSVLARTTDLHLDWMVIATLHRSPPSSRAWSPSGSPAGCPAPR